MLKAYTVAKSAAQHELEFFNSMMEHKMKHKKVSTLADLNTLDSEQITQGYLYGLKQDAIEPVYASRAFWHGWRNARIDRGFLPADKESANLAHEYADYYSGFIVISERVLTILKDYARTNNTIDTFNTGDTAVVIGSYSKGTSPYIGRLVTILSKDYRSDVYTIEAKIGCFDVGNLIIAPEMLSSYERTCAALNKENTEKSKEPTNNYWSSVASSALGLVTDGPVDKYLTNKVFQEELMKYDPTSGEENPYPSYAKHYRDYHGQNVAWLFNPWTGMRRTAQDVGSDLTGLLIL